MSFKTCNFLPFSQNISYPFHNYLNQSIPTLHFDIDNYAFLYCRYIIGLNEKRAIFIYLKAKKKKTYTYNIKDCFIYQIVFHLNFRFWKILYNDVISGKIKIVYVHFYLKKAGLMIISVEKLRIHIKSHRGPQSQI